VQVKDSAKVDQAALAAAGLPGAVEVGPGVWHLVAGLNADQHVETMNRVLAGSTKADSAKETVPA